MINRELMCAVSEFVSRETGVDVARLNPTTRLLHDLGVDGDDAIELLEHFSREFRVEVTIDVRRYFGPEGFNPIGWTAALFSGPPQFEALTISDLANAASAGRL